MELIKQEYRNILVPVDGSKTAEKALERATEIALRNKSTLRYFKCDRSQTIFR